MTSANHIILEEQGLRDGLQTLPIIVPLDTKLRWHATKDYKSVPQVHKKNPIS